MMIELLLGNLLPYILGGLAIVAALFGFGRQQKAKGRREVETELEALDTKEAQRVRKRLDANRRDGNAAERLRKQGRLRKSDKS